MNDPDTTNQINAPEPPESEAPEAGVGPRRLRGANGIATAEFAIVTLAAVAFAGLLVGILSSGTVRSLLMGLVRQALNY